jgi:hypothetical protein
MQNKKGMASSIPEPIFRLIKGGKLVELKQMVEEDGHHADFLRIFFQLEDRSLEELLETGPARSAKSPEPPPHSEHSPNPEPPSHPEIRPGDIFYRLRKSIQEPKRIFEAFQPYKRPAKGKK